jgi:hypothetical protein
MRRAGIFVLILLTMISCETTKKYNTALKSQPESFFPVHETFHTSYEQFREKSITQRRFKHAHVMALLDSFGLNPAFECRPVGKSLQGREIRLVKAGSGPVKVLLWSQMHGDEPTATMAIMDMLHYLGQAPGVDSLRDAILANTTVYFIPMLNPDGAEVYERRNAVGVDLNRDAIGLQSPEARILKSVRDSLQPHFGFNLHDQNPRYSAGRSNKPATISFLAPPYDYEKSVNDVRGNAMKVISFLNRSLQHYIPGQVAKYSDDHEARAFGDNIQKWGTSVVLVESGGYAADPEKQYIRKLNYTLLLTALHAIARKSYERENIDEYFQIPENARFLYDLVVRDALVERNGEWFRMDVGVNRYEVNAKNSTTFYYRSMIEELGDMSVNYGFDELDAAGMRAVPGRVYPHLLPNITAVRQLDCVKLLLQGYTTVRVDRYETPERYTDLPINIVTGKKDQNYEIALSQSPNFLLQENGRFRYAIVNGFVYDLTENKNLVKNALVY